MRNKVRLLVILYFVIVWELSVYSDGRRTSSSCDTEKLENRAPVVRPPYFLRIHVQIAGSRYTTHVQWSRLLAFYIDIKRVLSTMSFDTSWNVRLYRNEFESWDRWQYREKFLIVNKHKYPKTRLLILSDIFINIEFENCVYSTPIMDLIEKLSEGFVFYLRNNLNLPKTSDTDSNAAGAKDNENTFKKLKSLTPWAEDFVTPGFMILGKINFRQNQYEILRQSCSFSRIARPVIKHKCLSDDHFQAKLYLENKLIAIGDADTKDNATSFAWDSALRILMGICFLIKVKDYNEPWVTWLDVMDDSKIDTSNYTMHHNKISENNVGYMILKKMGWKEGDGLGKNNQGITSTIETIHFKESFGFDIENYDPYNNKTHLMNFNKQAEKYIMKFLYGPKKSLLFSTEFTKDERKIIHSICTDVGIWTKIYEKRGNKRQLMMVKKQTPQDIFDELSNCSNFENDYYILEAPRFESD